MNEVETPEHLRELVDELKEKPRMAFKEWLRKCLLGEIALPKAMPDDEPWDLLSDLDIYITDAARRNLEEGLKELLTDTIEEIEECAKKFDTRTQNIQKSEVFVPLLRVIVDLDLRSLAGRLGEFVKNEQAFFQLDADTRQRVLASMVDLRSPQEQSFWKNVCISDPGIHGGIAFAALATRNLISALELLPNIPENSSALDAIADVHLPLILESLTTDEIKNVRQTLENVLPTCEPGVQNTLRIFAKNPGMPVTQTPGKEYASNSAEHTRTLANIDDLLDHNGFNRGREMSPNIEQPEYLDVA